ncbi:2809_t:CDS:2, partial [Funneliformis geosporum]
GLTSHLQPLNVLINKSFKVKMRKNYNDWISESVKELTPAGRIKRLSYKLL